MNKVFTGYEVQVHGVTTEWEDTLVAADKAFKETRGNAKMYKHEANGTKRLIKRQVMRGFKLRDFARM